MTTAVGPRTRADHADRIDRALAYLSEHLDQDVDLERLADVACYSPFHFHRIYRALQGETVAETVRRMRLHRAALELLEAGHPIDSYRHARGLWQPGCVHARVPLGVRRPAGLLSHERGGWERSTVCGRDPSRGAAPCGGAAAPGRLQRDRAPPSTG